MIKIIAIVFHLFDLSLKLNGFPIEKGKRQLSEILAISEADFGDFSASSQRNIVQFHLENNSYYRNFVGKNSFENWSDLPIMQKKYFQKPLQERLSKGYTEKMVFVNKTSGSSGDPFIFAKDKDCHALTWASIIYRFGWFGIDFNTSYQARFYGIPLD
ncbi:MAG: phenylacetate--CoA ligase family protein, partial [Flavobacterium sp.]